MIDRWPTPVAWPLLGSDVHVWRVPIEGDVRRVEGLLSPDELERAARYHFERDRRAFTLTRGALREVLGRYTGRPGAALAFELGAQGKPRLPGGPAFSVSHAGAWALLAVSERELGVDLEPVRPLSEIAAMVPMVFDASDAARLDGLDGPERLEAFFAAWTYKEALVKAMGDGLSFGLPRLSVSFEPGAPPRLTAIDRRPEAGWSLVDLSFAGYRAALAIAGPAPEVLCWSWAATT